MTPPAHRLARGLRACRRTAVLLTLASALCGATAAAATVAERPAGAAAAAPLVLHAARLLDGTGGDARTDVAVVVRDGRIEPGSKVLYAHLGGPPALNGYAAAFL